jgi:hypothetical protein
MIPAIRNHLPEPLCRTTAVSDAAVSVFGPR